MRKQVTVLLKTHKIITYLFFAAAFVMVVGVICLIGYGFYWYWDLNHNWGSPN
jgi:hypothetical protein